VVAGGNLRKGSIRSCGCQQHSRLDLTGIRFGRLTVMRYADTRRRKARWLCKCECGSESIVIGALLRRNNTRSCGCLRGKFKRATHIFVCQRCGAPSSARHKSAKYCQGGPCRNERMIEKHLRWRGDRSKLNSYARERHANRAAVVEICQELKLLPQRSGLTVGERYKIIRKLNLIPNQRKSYSHE
jgi:hypothetical protein